VVVNEAYDATLVAFADTLLIEQFCFVKIVSAVVIGLFRNMKEIAAGCRLALMQVVEQD